MKKSHKQNKEVLVVVALFELQTTLLAIYTKDASPAFISICQQSRIVFLALFSILILKKRYNKIEFLGFFIVIVGLAFGNYSFSASKKDGLEVFAGLLVANFSASFGAIYFEKYIRHEIEDFNGYYLKFSLFSIAITSLFLEYEIMTKDVDWTYTASTPLLYGVCLSFFFLSYLTTLFSAKTCTIKRSFISLLITSLAGIFANLYLGIEVKIKEYISFLIISVGFLIAEYKMIIKMIKKKK